jgi:hypothetical protein
MATQDDLYVETGVTLAPEEAADLTGLLTGISGFLTRTGDDAAMRLALAEHFGAQVTPRDLASVLHRIIDDLDRAAAAEAVVISAEPAPDTGADF